MNKKAKHSFDAILFLVAFMVIQFVATAISMLIFRGDQQMAAALVAASAGSSVIAIVLFALLKWTPMSRHYAYTRPWGAFFWVFMAAIGLMALCSIVEHYAGFDMPDEYLRIFTQIMSHDWGYLCIGLLVPVAEEIVFRGAILRSLLKVFDGRLYWVAIVISAALFALVHGNMAQGLTAFIIGLLLGWMYYRTDSIAPGIFYHWVNNTIAYVVFIMMPGTADMSIVDMVGGSSQKVVIIAICSLCVLLPSLYQLSLRLKKN